MWSILLISTFLSLLPSVLTSILPPSQDPWYDQPRNIHAYKPGDIIRSRSVNPQLESFLSLPFNISVKSVSQFLFRTTDSLGEPVASVVTLFEPYNSDPTKLLGYQTYYDSSNVDCSPSYTLQAESDNLSASNASLDIPFIGTALNLGWWVYTTDYEGLEAQYTAGLQSGQAVLDSTRAVLHAGPSLGLSHHPRYVLWGYSGGALASSWAAELQPSYAPDLQFAGIAVGGTVPDIGSVLRTINNGSSAGLAFSGTYGQARAYPNMTGWLEGNLLEGRREEFFSIASGCSARLLELGDGMDLYSYFKGGEGAFEMDIPVSVFRWSGLLGLRGTPSAPMFVYKAVGDEISPVGDTDDVIAQYCGDGADIEYHRDLVGDHETESIAGAGSALAWLSDRLNGVHVRKGCRSEDVVITSLSVKTVALFGEILYSILETALADLL
ncbi:hypothetical protein N7490_011142 [Penicillium lividum]|nr:hypothetical protein N7490_011142 [Penicillium lividum]